MKFSSAEDGTTISTTDDTELIEAVRAVNSSGQAVAEANEEHRQAREHLVKVLEARGEKSLYVEIDGRVYKATVVAGERTKVDEEALREALGARKFATITTRKVDLGALRSAIVAGKIDPGLVSKHLTVVPNAVFPKITQMEGTPVS